MIITENRAAVKSDGAIGGFPHFSQKVAKTHKLKEQFYLKKWPFFAKNPDFASKHPNPQARSVSGFDGEKTEIQSKDDKSANTLALYDITTTKGEFVELSGTGIAGVTGLVANYAAGVTDANANGKIFEVSDGTLIVEGSTVASVTDSTRYFVINATKAASNVEEISEGAVVTIDAAKTYTYYGFKANDSAKTLSMVYFVRTA